MPDPTDEREADELRRAAYSEWMARGEALDDLTLRAAAQYAQTIGDLATERRIDGVLDAR